MREIKFRCWDGKKFSYTLEGPAGFQLGNSLPRLTFLFSNGGPNPEIGNLIFEIQQFTGLTTQTGTEIYEGDIINTKPARYKVIFKNGTFWGEYSMGISSDNIPVALLVDCGGFVIGNEFENPELLVDPLDKFLKK